MEKRDILAAILGIAHVLTEEFKQSPFSDSDNEFVASVILAEFNGLDTGEAAENYLLALHETAGKLLGELKKVAK
ncbi:hypothetical protein [Peribacillus butanolivorans]|uniref:Phage protein n=1 Tax=Peribacillus butanolivorans TaxID=421767 RepID=A0ABN5N2V9_9BACI|nr:hypothetical protein [Peribacillus butanolivorans]AXN39819.1 hypothetical protein DTO10_16585 [Peribacillus butanolivorans]